MSGGKRRRAAEPGQTMFFTRRVRIEPAGLILTAAQAGRQRSAARRPRLARLQKPRTRDARNPPSEA